MARKKKKYHPNHKGQKKCLFQYRCIDGNWTNYPVAICHFHNGVLTKALMKTHQCRERKCKRLQEGVVFE